ncbi:MAG: hypothetical protein U0O13_05065 [Oscillospiraceae bacterium]
MPTRRKTKPNKSRGAPDARHPGRLRFRISVQAQTVLDESAARLYDGIKLHACVLHWEKPQTPVHEVFVHRFRLSRRGVEMAHFLFLHRKKQFFAADLGKEQA